VRGQRSEEIKHLFNMAVVAMRDPKKSGEQLRQIASGLERLAYMEGFMPDPVLDDDGKVIAIRAMVSLFHPQKADPEFMFDPDNAERLEELKKKRVKDLRKKKRAEGKEPKPKKEQYHRSKDPDKLNALKDQALAMDSELALENFKHSFNAGVCEVMDGRKTLRIVVSGLIRDARTRKLRVTGVYTDGGVGGAARYLEKCTFV